MGWGWGWGKEHPPCAITNATDDDGWLSEMTDNRRKRFRVYIIFVFTLHDLMTGIK